MQNDTAEFVRKVNWAAATFVDKSCSQTCYDTKLNIHIYLCVQICVLFLCTLFWNYAEDTQVHGQTH